MLNDRQKRILTAIAGIGLLVLGVLLFSNSLQNLPRDVPSTPLVEKLRSSFAPTGTGLIGVGIMLIIFAIMWKKIPSRYKP